jgi:hypothetical protein
MKLSEGEINYSPNERRAFAILPKDGRRITTVEITRKIYQRSTKKPYYARQATLGVMDELVRKVMANKERFVIKRSARRGPHPISFWLEKA